MFPAETLRRSTLGVLLAGLLVGGCSGGGDAPAARVESESITDREVTALTDQWQASTSQQAPEGGPRPPEKRLRQVALLQLIKTRLVGQLAAREHIAMNAEELAGALAGETSSADLGTAGWAKESFESAMRSALLSKALAGKLFPSIEVPADRQRAYYDAHPEQFQNQWTATVDLAFFRDEKPATEFASRTVPPDRFSPTARDLGADDVLTKQVVSKASPLPEELLGTISSMRAGTTSQPVAAGRGFWVIRAADVRRQGSQSFEAAQAAIQEHLADQQRQAKFDDWLAERLRTAKIEVKKRYGTWPQDFL